MSHLGLLAERIGETTKRYFYQVSEVTDGNQKEEEREREKHGSLRGKKD